MTAKDERRGRWLLIAGLCSLMIAAAYCAWQVHQISAKRERIKYDSSVVNSITYGLLSANAWKENIQEILNDQIDGFDLSKQQDSTLRRMVTNMLDSLLTKTDSILENSDTTFKRKLVKLAVRSFVDMNALRKQMPQFSKTIVNNITSPENKERLKKIAHEKVNEYAASTYDDLDSLIFEDILHQYDTYSLPDFNTKTEEVVAGLQRTTYRYTYGVLGIMAFFLLLWIPLYKRPELRNTLFVCSVILGLIVLITGITTPMMEIDARIKKVDFVLMAHHIEFNNQILFYKSKSILQVVWLLLQTHEADSIVVGILILVFSIVLPLSKLISTEIYLMRENLRKNKLLYWLAMKSGKWSMADVMVIAITMTYVGIKGIVENQLQILNMETDTLTSITTNLTCLLPGFVLFLSFVIFGLVLSRILKMITPKSHQSQNTLTD